MSKKKVHELAKDLNMNAKDLITELEKLGITVKSHLSNLSDDEMKIIENSNLLNSNKNKGEKKVNVESDNSKKTSKNEKGANPIIIRREIQVVSENNKDYGGKTQHKEDIGVVEKKQKNDFKIINRDKRKQKTQVGSIADLFKKNENKDTNTNVNTNRENLINTDMAEELVAYVKNQILNSAASALKGQTTSLNSALAIGLIVA